MMGNLASYLTNVHIAIFHGYMNLKGGVLIILGFSCLVQTSKPPLVFFFSFFFMAAKWSCTE